MSISYGSATVQFPGFKAIRFTTVDDVMCLSYRFGWWNCVTLPRRGFILESERRRLSRKERSALRTLSKKWNKRSRRGADYRLIPAFRTIHEESY